MRPPRLVSALLRWLSPPDRLDDVLGDLAEAHGRRVRRRGRLAAWWLTTLEGLDMALALAWARIPRPRPRFSALDVRLAARMLRRYPGLTMVAGLALGFAIAVGAVTFEAVTQILYPSLPVAGGDRLVGFRQWNAETGRPETATAADLDTWRTQLRSVEHVGAFRSTTTNLITSDGQSDAIEVAEISAAAFSAVPVPARLGRTLVTADEGPGAPDVVVIDFDLWQRRFGGAPDVIGREARLGDTPVTIVGVMPAGFGFPVTHQAWLPLRTSGTPARAAGSTSRSQPGRTTSPAVHFVFGRLSPGASLASAQAEVAALGVRTAADFPNTRAHVRPEVLPYVEALLSLSRIARAAIGSINLAAVLFVVLVAANVALLTVARTVSRERELAVRSALGASRGRLVTQVFIEALVLAIVAAAAGLGLASVAMRWAFWVVDVGLGGVGVARWPFWLHPGLSPLTAIYALVLAVLVAAIAGAGPAFRATGGIFRWQGADTGGATARFGGVWTAVIVTQVAVTVACLPVVVDVGLDTSRIGRLDLGVGADDYLTARLTLPDDTSGPAAGNAPPTESARARFAAASRALIDALAVTPGVTAATFGTPPGTYAPLQYIDVDGPAEPARRSAGHRPQVAAVAPGFFAAMGAPLVAGRGFAPADVRENPPPIVVNESFARDVLGNSPAAAVGRRVRIRASVTPDSGAGPAEPEPWLTIVGVTTDLQLGVDPDLRSNAGIYTPRAVAAMPIALIVHVPDGAEAFAPTLRAVAARVDTALRVSQVSTLGGLMRTEAQFYEFWFRVSLVAISILLLLSLSGIYAVVSFTVSRRTREIGVRVALGADRVRLLSSVLASPMVRVLFGAMAGAAAIAMLPLASEGHVAPRVLGLFAGSAGLVVFVSVLACAVPIRRALRVQPTEALRAED